MTELFKPQRVRKLGQIRHFKTPTGNTIIVLPTCTVPLGHLMEENWNMNEAHGLSSGTRVVTRIRRLKNGRKTSLITKEPERKFTAYPGLPFPWSFARPGPWALYTPNNDRRVEIQTVKEARILLGLAHYGMRAEKPQAIVIRKDGRRELIVKVIKFHHHAERYREADKANASVEKKGFKPRDLTIGNLLYSRRNRNRYIIDVNRWEWPPVTDKYKRMLAKAIAEEVERKKKTKGKT